MKSIFSIALISSMVLVLAACNPSEGPYQKQAEMSAPTLTQTPVPLDSLTTGIKFFESSLPSYVLSVRGLAAPESFGRWSNAKLVLVDFTGPLPEGFDLELVLGGYSKNVGANLQIIVGTETKDLKIKTDLMHMQSYTIHFSNPDKASSIALIIPFPVSPQSTGDSANDPRMLGIALQSMYIRPIQQATNSLTK